MLKIGKATPTAELKLATSFACNRKVRFLLSCITHLTKNDRNALLRTGNDFHHPKLVLFIRICVRSRWLLRKIDARFASQEQKKVASSMRMSNSVAHIDNLNKQKASPALEFSQES